MSLSLRNIGGIAFAVLLLLFVGGLTLAAFVILRLELSAEPNVPLKPAVATTFLVEPLDESGNIDFALAVNEYFSNGVVPAENAMAHLARLVVPETEDETTRKVYDLLCVNIPSPGDDVWIGEEDWIDENHPDLTSQERERFIIAAQYARSNLWNERSFPLLTEYLQANQGVILATQAAASLNRSYLPIVAPPESNVTIMESTMPLLINVRNLTHGLGIQANWLAEKGDFEKWLPCVLAMKKMGNLAAVGHSFVQKLVGIALHNMAHRNIALAIRAASFNEEQLKKLRRELLQLPTVGGYSETIRYGESLMALEFVQQVAQGKIGLMGVDMKGHQRGINWNTVSSKVNEFYIRAQSIFELQDPVDKFEQSAAIVAELEQEIGRIELMNRMIFGDAENRSQLIGDVIIQLVFAPLEAFVKAQADHETKKQLLLLANDLELFNMANQNYPATLEALVPEYRESVEPDKFLNQPIVYRPKNGSYELYSLGANKTDNKNDPMEDCTLLADDQIPFDKYLADAKKERQRDDDEQRQQATKE